MSQPSMTEIVESITKSHRDLCLRIIRKTKVVLGGTALVAAAGKEEFSYEKNIGPILRRHFRGDWGDLTDFDKEMNEDALLVDEGERLVSSYNIDRQKIFIITNAGWKSWKEGDLQDYFVTTVMYSEDY